MPSLPLRSSLFAFALSLLALGACSSSDETGGQGTLAPAPECAEGTPGCIGWLSCPPEFEKATDGAYCREIVAPADCAAGSMALLGSRECVPVGPPSCGAGFEPDPSGWGCRAVVPSASCTGATRDALGSTSCVPVGDCNAPFPPAGATLVINEAFTNAELGPTKFRSFAAAMAEAKAGDTIAVESGTYAEGIVAKSNVTIIGRCAEKVRLVGTGADKHGVLAMGVDNVVVKGVTLVDHYEGARAQGGAELTLEDVVIEEPRFTGLIAWQPRSSIRAERVVVRNVKPHATQTVAVVSVNADEGATIDLVDAAITGSWEAGAVATNQSTEATPSTLRLTRTVIRDTNVVEHSLAGGGVVVSGHSKGEVKESAILDTRGIAALSLFDGADLLIERSEIRRTLEDSGDELSAGAYAEESGKITLDGVSIHEATQSGLLARGKGAITARSTVVHGTTPGADALFGMGAWADSGGTVALERTALVDNAYYGVSVLDAPSSAKLKDVLVRGTKAQTAREGGLGRGINVEDGAAVEIDGASLVGNDGQGLFLRGETKSGKRARASARRLYVSGGTTPDSNGLFVARGALAEIDGGVVANAQRAGVIVNETTGEAGSRSEAVLAHVVVRGTLQSSRPGSTADEITLDGFGVASAGHLTMQSCAVVDNVQFGIIVGSPDGTTTIASTHVGGTGTNADGQFGHGITAFKGTSLTIQQCEIARSSVGLVFDGAGAVVADSRVRANGIGIHVQNGSTLSPVGSAPEAYEPGVVFVTEDSQFIDNESRVGGGEVPMPSNPFAAASP